MYDNISVEQGMKLKSDYSLLTRITLAYWFLRTKMIFPKAKIIRFPLDLRGRRMISVGEGFTTGRYCRIEAFISNFDNEKELPLKIRIGKNVQINDCTHISAVESVEIGNNVLIAGNCYISDNSHGFYKDSDLTKWGGQFHVLTSRLKTVHTSMIQS